MQLLFQNNSYRVVYAPEPRKNHADWGFTRRIKESNTLQDRWECLNCTRAILPSASLARRSPLISARDLVLETRVCTACSA